MKKFISLFVLIIGLALITYGTIYTLGHKDVRDKIEDKVNKTIDKVTTNMGANNLTEIFNVYFNNTRHKVKLEYNIDKYEDLGISNGSLTIYLDGKSILNGNIIKNIEELDIKKIFENEFIDNYVRIKETNFKIIKNNDKEYLEIEVGSYNGFVDSRYYLFDDDGVSLIKEGILVVNTNLFYEGINGEELDFFYEGNTWGKYDEKDNSFYSLCVDEVDTLKINEYKYSFNGDTLDKKLINTYVDIKIKEI